MIPLLIRLSLVLVLLVSTGAGCDATTAEELSKPGALQAYINNGMRTGEVKLPMGTITFNKTIWIPRTNGGTISGYGAPYHPDPQHGWNRKDIFRGTRLKYTGPIEEPAIIWRSSHGQTLEKFGVETEGDIGILYPHTPGWGGADCDVKQVSFYAPNGVGFQAGEKKGDFNCADINFYSCQFGWCERGFVSKNTQALVFFFHSLRAIRCETVIDQEHGGSVSVFGAGLYDVDTFYRCGQGGVNTQPCVFVNIRCDRNANRLNPIPPTQLIDSSDASSTFVASVIGCAVTGYRGEVSERFLINKRAHHRVKIQSVSTSVKYPDFVTPAIAERVIPGLVVSGVMETEDEVIPAQPEKYELP